MKKTLRFLVLCFVCLVLVFASACSCKKCNKQQQQPPQPDEVKITSIAVVTSTIPSSIYTNEVEDKIDDIQIQVLKSDGNQENINLDKTMISAEDFAKLSTEGTYTITVNYKEFTTTVTLVIVKEKEIIVPPVVEEIEYSVLIKDIAGKPLANFYVEFYKGSDIIAEGYTTSNGTFVTNQLPDIYDVRIEEREGYYLNKTLYTTDLLGTTVEITADLESLAGIEADAAHRYEVGDLMYDFTITDIDNNVLNLYTLLEEYDAVFLNFWYTTCTYCVQEFPYMTEAYESSNTAGENYKDKIAIIAINPTIAGNGDTLDGVKNFRDQMGLTFNVALDIDADKTNLTMDPYLTAMFSIEGYPTTVVIDRYGLIAAIESGALIGTDKWVQTFDSYIGEDYTPKYVGSNNGEIVLDKPDIEQEDSSVLEEAVNGTNYDDTPFIGTYAPEDNSDAEYSWPWVVKEFDGKTCIAPSNQSKNYSFSIVYVTTYMKEGDVFAFDYYSSTESYDTLYIVVNDVIVTSISGKSPNWEKSYAYVALEEGEHEIGFCYLKDESYSEGEDAVFITNIRLVETNDIDKETYIYRDCATGMINQFTDQYTNYVEVFYNVNDGYYHVGSENGPLLLADMLSGTKWNNSDLYSISLEGKCIGADGVDYNAIVEKYAIYASNSSIGYTPVTEELAEALRQITKELGSDKAKNNPNQWLEVCVYYSAYGTNGVELGVPTIGVCPFEPIMMDGNGIDEPATSEATFNRIILPRGFIFGFIPETSGVYKFYTTEEQLETIGWFCDLDGEAIRDVEEGLREFAKQNTESGYVDNNFIIYEYLEAGQLYLFRAAFYDVSEYSTITVALEYVSEKEELLTIASPGFFTSSDDEMNDIISGNFVDLELGDDGYYHVVGSNSTDDLIYCDIVYLNNITGYSINDCVERFDAFNFNKDEFGQLIYDEEGYFRYSGYNEEEKLVSFYVCEDAEGNIYYVETLGEGEFTEENGYTYIKFTKEQIDAMGQLNYTEYVRDYIAKNMITDTESELYGCVKVDEKFGYVLGLLMDKYTFPDVEYSWAKLCYYYRYVGPQVSE